MKGRGIQRCKLGLPVHWQWGWSYLRTRRDVYTLFLWRLDIWIHHYACAVLAARIRKWSIKRCIDMFVSRPSRGYQPAGYTWRGRVRQTMGAR